MYSVQHSHVVTNVNQQIINQQISRNVLGTTLSPDFDENDSRGAFWAYALATSSIM